jgi:2-C-methyl-D-erythritol 4-phosphate cytidylyltransferase
MGSSVPKQFLLLNGKAIIWHSVNAFLSAFADLQVILVLPEGHMAAGKALAESFGSTGRILLTIGGGTRFHSVGRGLELIDGDAVVAVHDGVRCLVSTHLVHRCFEQATRLGSAIPVVDCRDSVRILTDAGSEVVDRTRVKLVQTPQTFLSEIILPAYSAGFRESFTDEASVVEAAGHTVHLIEGEVNNIKITLPADLLLAEALLSHKNGVE